MKLSGRHGHQHRKSSCDAAVDVAVGVTEYLTETKQRRVGDVPWRSFVRNNKATPHYSAHAVRVPYFTWLARASSSQVGHRPLIEA